MNKMQTLNMYWKFSNVTRSKEFSRTSNLFGKIYSRLRNQNKHQKCFDSLKQALEKSPTLSYFHLQRKTQLIADASPIALEAVLLQFDDKDNSQVISFARQNLSEVEKRYSQTEKASLALVWALERFLLYLTGLTFELVTAIRGYL